MRSRTKRAPVLPTQTQKQTGPALRSSTKRGRPKCESAQEARKKPRLASSPAKGEARSTYSECFASLIELLNARSAAHNQLTNAIQDIGTLDSKVDQEIRWIAANCNPDGVGRAEQIFHGSGYRGANPIVLVDNDKARIPQQIRGEVRDSESVNSAKREASEEAKMTTPISGGMDSQQARTTSNPTDKTEKESVASNEERREAVYKGSQPTLQASVEKEPNTSDEIEAMFNDFTNSPKATDTGVALQGSDEAGTISSLCGEVPGSSSDAESATQSL